MLFRNPNSEAARYYLQLNADTPWVKPGHILIVADPHNPQQGPALHHLRQAKNQVNKAMAQLDAEQATFLQRNYDTLATILNGSSTGLGIASDSGKRYFQRIDEILQRIEITYQNQFRTQGTLIGQQFFVERNRLFGELKAMLDKPVFSRLTRKILNLRPYESIKSALNLSSRSIVHEWSTAGVGAIRGYSTYLEGAGKGVKFMKNLGWVGLAVSATGTTNDIYHACTTDRKNECTRTALKGYGEFSLGIAGGTYGGSLGSAAGVGVCVALGIASAPAGGVAGLACAIIGATVGGAAGSAAGGYMGRKGGDYAADIILK
ncbi:hypothetical protein [Serratia rubidaea]|uniref:hypothetical protein n=1 Tax=Serratia rubidaea TaxID=61652 RepID=UPI001F3313DA|nr:hypothetical protein [Serratia rubidaea]